ncbi:MAG: inositol monophosphatase [Myxococcales bacterium]|nr:inositol monophosphatase [Myxococcales bacterium]
MNGPVLQLAIELAQRAGDIQRTARERGITVEPKGISDIVTAVDTACEQAIVAAISERFPDHGIVAEEGSTRGTSARCQWVIDPLDGTKNYAHGSVRCGVSIAVQLDGVTQIGVLYAPFVDELFVAERGRGARCNEHPIAVSKTTELAACMVASALTYAAGSRSAEPRQLDHLLRVFSAVQALRSHGCCTLDLADVARGRLDAYFEPGLAAWDTAAGALLVQEAGGRVSSFDGEPHRVQHPHILASNGHVHAALRSILATERA